MLYWQEYCFWLFQHITPNWEQLPSREPTGFLSDSAEAQRVAIDERVSASFQQMSIIGAEIDWKEDIYSDPALVSRLDDVVDASPLKIWQFQIQAA